MSVGELRIGEQAPALVFVEAAGAQHLETVFFENLRGTRGSFSAVSGGQDGLVFG